MTAGPVGVAVADDDEFIVLEEETVVELAEELLDEEAVVEVVEELLDDDAMLEEIEERLAVVLEEVTRDVVVLVVVVVEETGALNW